MSQRLARCAEIVQGSCYEQIGFFSSTFARLHTLPFLHTTELVKDLHLNRYIFEWKVRHLLQLLVPTRTIFGIRIYEQIFRRVKAGHVDVSTRRLYLYAWIRFFIEKSRESLMVSGLK